jgi:hydrogenase maturation protein HypF
MQTSDNQIIAKQACIGGIVQGVGFRPYLFRLAHRHGLCGQVINTAAGVTVWVEGEAARVEAFLRDLPLLKPPLAQIVSMHVTLESAAGYADFTIGRSSSADARSALIAPDMAVCDECLREMFDPLDRRHRYPFINCTNCGPRYTIIEDVPYDRPKTAMRGFELCDLCRAEYEDPLDRRYHAQPNACAACGPQVTLHDHLGQPLPGEDPIAQAARLIRDGRIVAVKGLGGFHLAVDPFNDDAVERLRARKHREEKPLAVMAAGLEAASELAVVSHEDAELLLSPQRPIVLLPKRLPERLAFSVAPRNLYYGVMLPYTPLHHLLLACGAKALVMTSANLTEEPLAIDNEEAFGRLSHIADYFMVHDRPIYLRSDDSIVRRAGGQTRLIRRSRGFVPLPVFLKKQLPPVLACGAELKSTVCLTKGNQAFVSQHIGDLENPSAEDFFRLTIDHLQRILDISPQAIACDPHPDYLSTRWAAARTDLPVIQVQHHHAHIAACMAEHHQEEQVIGLAFDGTGLGPDGTIWGGEVLLADLLGYERAGHLACVPMPGGAAAIKEPWRMGLAWLHHTFGDGLRNLNLPFIKALSPDKAGIIVQMAARRINSPLTSSLGRLFDAVAAIIGLRGGAAFEGQAAMELEMIADSHSHGIYPFQWSEDRVPQAHAAPIIASIVEDIRRGVPAFLISRKFHDTLAAMWAAVCVALRARTGIDRVALSGGCFQNVLLLEGLTHALQNENFTVYSHQLVPTNDGGIALGQAVVAAEKLKNMKVER